MRLLIVDDEPLGLARLNRMLNSLGYTDIMEATNAEAAIEMAKSQAFDLALLDINMPNISGLELAYELKAIQAGLPVIFQTAYENHALEAFGIGAIGYLVKPFSIEELKKSIERLQLTAVKEDKELYLMSKNGENYYMLKPADIYYIKADLTEVMLRSAEGYSYYAQKISDVEQLLASYNFFKVHRSYLVNIDKIKEMETIEQSKLRFSFFDINDQVDSSKDGAKFFRQRFASL